MTQLAIYIEDQLSERLEKAVKNSGKSKSRSKVAPQTEPFSSTSSNVPRYNKVVSIPVSSKN